MSEKIDSGSLAGGGKKNPKQGTGFRSGIKDSVFQSAYKCTFCGAAATKAVVWGSITAFIPTCAACQSKATHKIEKYYRDDVDGIRDLPLVKSAPTAAGPGGSVLIPPEERIVKEDAVPEFREKAEGDDGEDSD